MDSKPKLPSSSREMRNIAEKMRRDKLNNYVSELASIVPLVCGSNKRIDKTSVLRLAANYIRMHSILGDVDDEKIPTTPGPPVHRGLMHSLEEAIGGFLLVVTSSGKVLFITEAVESFFGYSQVDLLGNSIYNVIHPEDLDILKEQLDSKDESRRSFFCRMMEKALSRNDPNRYEIIHIVGTMKPLPERWPSTPAPTTPKPNPGTSESTDSNYSDSDEDESQSVHTSNRVGTHMLVSFVRVVKDRPITELSLVESTQEEYITRHTMDGKILYTDHRISFVTGLMPTEVLGTSAFKYMHSDDMVWSMVAHKLMFTSTQGQGLVSYRLKCKGGTLVTLRSRGYIELNKQTGQAETFVCINTVVSNKEADNEIRNQRRKLLPMFSGEQSEEHLGSVSSSMPPELISMMKQLIDSKTIQKMITEIDPSMNLAAVFGSQMAQQADMFKGLDEKSPIASPVPEYSDKNHDDCTLKGYQKTTDDKKEKPSKISRKRNSKTVMCSLPPKIPNQSNMCKPIADVYHQSYSPQGSIPLPNLSPDTVQPLLCTSSSIPSPSSAPLPHEKPSFSPHTKYLESSCSIHMPREGHSIADTNIIHSHSYGEPEGLEPGCHQPMRCTNVLLNDNYQDCRQCNKKGSYSMDHSQGFHPHSAGISQQPTRSNNSTGTYQCQSRPENIKDSKYPSSPCNQDQMEYPQYVGSTNGEGSRNILIQAHQYPSYPHPYTSSSYQTNLSCCPSVPEFDVKLQRKQQPQHQHTYHQFTHSSQQSHYLTHQQRIHAQQNWLSRSTTDLQSSVMGVANPIAASPAEAFHNIPNHHRSTPSADQDQHF